VLILTRRKGERIEIGDNIQVMVTDIVGGQVKIGIVAPKEIPVRRSELSK
jgi:carbon storage regulator